MPDSTLIASAMLGPGKESKPTPKPVNNNLRTDWNSYVDWLEKKGLKGHPSLDHNDLAGKMIDQYRKENPKTSISRDTVIPIQQEFSKYRDTRLKEIESGSGAFAPGVTKDNFLQALSVVDGIPGQRTTSFKFPDGIVKNKNTGTVENKGFMTSEKPAIDQLTAIK